jgi:hypothetical protein
MPVATEPAGTPQPGKSATTTTTYRSIVYTVLNQMLIISYCFANKCENCCALRKSQCGVAANKRVFIATAPSRGEDSSFRKRNEFKEGDSKFKKGVIPN